MPPPAASGTEVSPRLLGWAAVILLLGFVALSAVLLIDVRAPLFQRGDEAVTATVAAGQTGALTTVALFLHHFGQWPLATVWLVALLLPLAVARRWDSIALVVGAWAGTSLLAVPFFKAVVDRVRPLEQLVVMASPSYPSGHTAFAAVVTMSAVAVCPPKWRAWALVGSLVCTAAMGWSRIYVGVHWFSDTMGGALLGWGIALLAWWAVARVHGIRAGRIDSDAS
ncbi:hypothetical protein Nans01_24630 [Nocardiopsis ansamitocini]|uniref:Phosphatidic acid phosphatase type 2/haloperoxidase domain-containing protein n=1 Tax=Nocardiopsis ansamitocini TaxID=1670832 RepID=A0A9W6P6V0_9ACTN|nr:hypothetical protein Nans01_24630 [Nocardiopsis ansamitocini]